MTEYPNWLPDIVELNDYYNWELYIDAVYEIYLNDFVENKFKYNSKEIAIRRHPESLKKGFTFWHIVQDGDGSGSEDDREVNLRRCERVPWIKPVILNSGDTSVKVWTHCVTKKRGTKPRIHFWFNDEYLVVLEERKNYTLLITAFPTDIAHKRRSLEKQFRASL